MIGFCLVVKKGAFSFPKRLVFSNFWWLNVFKMFFFSFLNHFKAKSRSLDLAINALRKTSVTKFASFAPKYLFFIGACLFKVSMNTFVKFVKLVNSRFLFYLLDKEFKSSRHKLFEKVLKAKRIVSIFKTCKLLS